MPTVNVTLPKGAWTPEDNAKLVEEVTAAVARAAVTTGKVPDVETIIPMVSVQVHETAQGGYAAGGKIFG